MKARVPAALASLALAVGCGATFGMSPQDIDASARECQRRIADGSYDLRTMPGVGFAPPAQACGHAVMVGFLSCTLEQAWAAP